MKLAWMIDDDREMAEATRLMLKLLGWEMRHFPSARAAGAELLAGNRPDFFLLDVNMPAEDGPSLLRRLHRQGTHPAVVFLTARASDDDRHRYVAMGAAAVVAKPFDPMQLASTLRQIYRDQAGD